MSCKVPEAELRRFSRYILHFELITVLGTF